MSTEQTIAFRRAVRGHLAERPSVSQAPATIHRFMGRDVPGTVEDVARACEVLTALGQLHAENDPIGGSTKYYRVTAQGILDHEAGR